MSDPAFAALTGDDIGVPAGNPADPSPAVTSATATAPGVLHRLLHDPQGVFALAVLALVVLGAIFAPLLTTHDPAFANLSSILARPGVDGHLLGGDGAGRDVFARLLFGARNSLLGALLGAAVAVGVGTVSGLIAGYFGKWFDSLSNASASLLQALPGIIVLLAVRSVIGPSMWWAMVIFGVLLSAGVFRLVRQTVQSVRNELYVDAARVAGLTDARIIFRHVLRVVRAPIIIQAGFIMMSCLGIQASLEILGLGDLTLITWGGMLNDAFARIFQQPLLILWPGLMLALVCLALTLLSNALRDALQGGKRAARRAARRAAPLVQPVAVGPVAVVGPGAVEPVAVVDSGAAGPVIIESVAVEPASAAAPDTANLTDGSNELLRIENVRIGYDQPDGSVKEIVHGITLEVNRGEVVGLIGESGSGKTQTAFSVMRLLGAGGRILSGRVLWKGQDLATMSEKQLENVRGKQLAYIPQEPMSNLDPSFTIGQQMVEPMRHHLGLGKTEARARAIELLDRVGIRNPELVFNKYPHEVSGGMAQRVLIASAVSCQPDLIIADEPTTALDVTVQADILDLLRSLQQELGLGVLMVTHNFGIVADLCDRVVVMKDGEIVERGDTRAMFVNHNHPYTKQLFGAILSPDQFRAPYQPPVNTRLRNLGNEVAR